MSSAPVTGIGVPAALLLVLIGVTLLVPVTYAALPSGVIAMLWAPASEIGSPAALFVIGRAALPLVTQAVLPSGVTAMSCPPVIEIVAPGLLFPVSTTRTESPAATNAGGSAATALAAAGPAATAAAAASHAGSVLRVDRRDLSLITSHSLARRIDSRQARSRHSSRVTQPAGKARDALEGELLAADGASRPPRDLLPPHLERSHVDRQARAERRRLGETRQPVQHLHREDRSDDA